MSIKLGLKDQEIDDIKMNERHDVLEQRHKALNGNLMLNM